MSQQMSPPQASQLSRSGSLRKILIALASFIIITIAGGIITDTYHFLWDWFTLFMHWQYSWISVVLFIIVILLGSLIATLIWKKCSLDQYRQALAQEQSNYQQLKQELAQEQSDHQQLKDEYKAIKIILNRLETFNPQGDSNGS